jgi:hypothetical protein
MRTSRVSVPCFRAVTGEALPDVSRSLAFLSSSRVAPSAISSPRCAGAHDRYYPIARPSPVMTGDGVARSCLGNRPTFVPNARSRVTSEETLCFLGRVSSACPVLALIQASPKHPCPLHGDTSVSGRGHARVPSSTSSLATTARERDACTVRCRSSALA